MSFVAGSVTFKARLKASSVKVVKFTKANTLHQVKGNILFLTTNS
jgi:hypothetical protein